MPPSSNRRILHPSSSMTYSSFAARKTRQARWPNAQERGPATTHAGQQSSTSRRKPGRRKRGVHRSRPDSKLAVQRPICHEISFGETQDERRIGNRRVSVEIPGYKSVGQIIAQGESLGRRRRTQHPRRFELASLTWHPNRARRIGCVGHTQPFERARRIGHGGLIRHLARTRPSGRACRTGTHDDSSVSPKSCARLAMPCVCLPSFSRLVPL